MIYVLNANTLAMTEYSLAALDVVEHEGEVWFVTATGLSKLSVGAEDETVASSISTGSIDFGTPSGKRCTSIMLDTTSDEAPSVFIIDQDDAEFITVARSGAGTKRKREYNAPRGVLTSRLGVKIASTHLDLSGLSISIIESARK